MCLRHGISLMIITILFSTLCRAQENYNNNFPLLIGPYLGQKPPGKIPEIFAPGIVSSKHQEHSSLSFSPDGKEMWWSRWRLPYDHEKYPQVIMFMKYKNSSWSQPKVAPFSGKYREGSPTFSPDGMRIYFYSHRPLDKDSETINDNDIWYIKRTKNGWDELINIGEPINTPFVEATPCLAANGNIYFTSDRNQSNKIKRNNDLFVSKFTNGIYGEPESVSAEINTPWARESFPYVAPDESYIIFSRDSRKVRFRRECHCG